MKNVVIIGGGLAGLLSGIQLQKAGISCTVVEKKTYPFHRVCGEYISNETIPFLQSLNLFPADFNPPTITRFQLSSVDGRNCILPLDLGGFGISRYTFDHFLFTRAKASNVEFLLNTEVENLHFNNDRFSIVTPQKTFAADIVIGAFGKRSKLDVLLNRKFIQRRSPYVGIKYHIKTGHPADLIALHNFEGGYCGISNVEDNKTNLCYLTHRDHLKRFRSIEDMEKAILHKNPHLKKIFTDAEFLFAKPEVINEISFETKAPVENHILMAGDSAGMITPLCGNGMAMAMRASKIVSDLVIHYCHGNITRQELEKLYEQRWRKAFSQRLWIGRQVQRLFGSNSASNFAVNLAIHSRAIANAIVRNTHGKPF